MNPEEKSKAEVREEEVSKEEDEKRAAWAGGRDNRPVLGLIVQARLLPPYCALASNQHPAHMSHPVVSLICRCKWSSRRARPS